MVEETVGTGANSKTEKVQRLEFQPDIDIQYSSLKDFIARMRQPGIFFNSVMFHVFVRESDTNVHVVNTYPS
mgnify:CR=1 FL=1|tara:strand:- start:188 stop:403 length:216 start_codon:yes stop_codon:yes gene_type:complete